jgi:hypothetical protein
MKEIDKRIGKEIRGPEPKCPHCDSYMYRETYPFDKENPHKWLCPNCNSCFKINYYKEENMICEECKKELKVKDMLRNDLTDIELKTMLINIACTLAKKQTNHISIVYDGKAEIEVNLRMVK